MGAQEECHELRTRLKAASGKLVRGQGHDCSPLGALVPSLPCETEGPVALWDATCMRSRPAPASPLPHSFHDRFRRSSDSG
jgi:hypothetical protein